MISLFDNYVKKLAFLAVDLSKIDKLSEKYNYYICDLKREKCISLLDVVRKGIDSYDINGIRLYEPFEFIFKYAVDDIYHYYFKTYQKDWFILHKNFLVSEPKQKLYTMEEYADKFHAGLTSTSFKHDYYLLLGVKLD